MRTWSAAVLEPRIACPLVVPCDPLTPLDAQFREGRYPNGVAALTASSGPPESRWPAGEQAATSLQVLGKPVAAWGR